MDLKLCELQYECDKLRNRLSAHEELQSEVEGLKEELETSLESHKKLQEVALAFELENRNIQSKYTEQLIDKSKLSAVKVDLEHEVETKKVSYGQLEKKYNKLREKSEKVHELEEVVISLEREKKRNVEKIKELEETLHANCEDIEAQSKRDEAKINKLKRENDFMNTKLTTYIEEMEDMDGRMESLEQENKMFEATLKKMKEIEVFGNHFDHIQTLEKEKLELMNKLEKEKELRDNVENELFRTEEELENYISREEEMYDDATNDDGDVNVPSVNEISEVDDNTKSVVLENEMTIRELEDENTLLQNKMATMQEELDALLEENSSLAKRNMELQCNSTQDGEDFEAKLVGLEEKLDEMEEGRKQIEQDTFNRLVTSAEKEYECARKQKEEINENERLRDELKAIQENLGASNSQSIEMKTQMEIKEKEYQVQLDDAKEELKGKLQGLKQALEEETRSKYEEKERAMEEEQKNFMNQMETKMQTMKEEYEGKLVEQNSTIKNLEKQITSMKGFYESNTSSTNIAPVTIQNSKCYSTGDIRLTREGSIGSGDTLSGVSSVENDDVLDCGNDLTSNDVHLMKNNNDSSVTNNYTNYDNDSSALNESTCGLSDREMRRISYKVAEGSWKRLSLGLPISEDNLGQIMKSNGNGQEKVYRLLNCWIETESSVPRLELLRQLTEYVDPNRKDVIKFLKEMAGIPTKERKSIKNRFRKLKLSVKR